MSDTIDPQEYPIWNLPRRHFNEMFYRRYIKVGVGITVDGTPLLLVLECTNRGDHDIPADIAIALGEIPQN